MDDVGAALSLMAILGFVAFAIWHKDQSRQEQRRQNLRERESLFERIGTGDALTRFLQTEEGKRMLEEINEPSGERRSGMKMSVIGLLTAGVICTFVGGGFIAVAPEVNETLLIPGFVVGAVGFGCLVSALIHYILGRTWGLLDPEAKNGRSRSRLG